MIKLPAELTESFGSSNLFASVADKQSDIGLLIPLRFGQSVLGIIDLFYYLKVCVIPIETHLIYWVVVTTPIIMLRRQ